MRALAFSRNAFTINLRVHPYTKGGGGGGHLTTAGWGGNRAHPCGVEFSFIETCQLQLSDGLLRRGRGSLPVVDQGLFGQLPSL